MMLAKLLKLIDLPNMLYDINVLITVMGITRASKCGTGDGMTPTLFSYKLPYNILLLTRKLFWEKSLHEAKVCLQTI